jgi:hypothetical protein
MPCQWLPRSVTAANERRNLRTYYASCEYENDAEPGEYAAITILGDDDGPHLVFSTGEVVILDLPIPACEALAISYALGRAGRHAIVAAEHLTERLADLRTEGRADRRAEPPPLEPGMTPYGPREIPAARHPEPAGLSSGRRDTGELPGATYSWMRAPAVPERQSA